MYLIRLLIKALPCVFITVALSAQEFRFVYGEAILSLPHAELYRTADSGIAERRLAQIKNESFAALSSNRISGGATHVRLKRSSRGLSLTRRYSKFRDPCHRLVIRRIARVTGLTCEPNYTGFITATPNDPMLSNQYAASSSAAGRVNLPGAWDIATGSADVIVGVVDTGIDYTHQDLAGNIWSNPGEIAANGIDDDGNGYIDDIHGVDPINSDSDPDDDQSHGTHISGTIGAVGNNAIGVAGINWDVTIIGCKAFNSSGVGSVATISACLNYLANLRSEYGFNIVATNNSYGGFPFTNAMYNSVAATRDAGITFVAGAGNDGADSDLTPFYPASFDLPNIISVGATDSQGNKTSISNFGLASVDLSAPGVGVLSTIPGNQYAYFQGTSVATPHVTGAIALLLAHRPGYTYNQVIQSVLSTGRVMAGLSGFNATGSILNVEGMLQFIADEPAPVPTPTPSIPSPEPPPSADGPNLSTAKLDISAAISGRYSDITCELAAIRAGSYVGLPGQTVSLSVKGVRAVRESVSDENGAAHFSIKIRKRKVSRVRCAATIVDTSNIPITVKSKRIPVR